MRPVSPVFSFSKEFNTRTAHLEPGIPIPTLVNIAADRTFTFTTKSEHADSSPDAVEANHLLRFSAPPTTLLLKRAAGITTGSGKAGSDFAGTVSLKHIYEIAKIKMGDLGSAAEPATGAAAKPTGPTVGEEQMCKIVAGSARSMGIRVVR